MMSLWSLLVCYSLFNQSKQTLKGDYYSAAH